MNGPAHKHLLSTKRRQKEKQVLITCWVVAELGIYCCCAESVHGPTPSAHFFAPKVSPSEKCDTDASKKKVFA